VIWEKMPSGSDRRSLLDFPDRRPHASHHRGRPHGRHLKPAAKPPPSPPRRKAADLLESITFLRVIIVVLVDDAHVETFRRRDAIDTLRGHKGVGIELLDERGLVLDSDRDFMHRVDIKVQQLPHTDLDQLCGADRHLRLLRHVSLLRE
jgi:hypothetical protein